MIKARTKAFADKLLENPKMSQAQAYMETHETNNARAASVTATRLLAKPEVQVYMEKHINRARNKIVELSQSDNEKIALSASQDIMDRSYGKALTKSSNLNIDISFEQAIDALR